MNVISQGKKGTRSSLLDFQQMVFHFISAEGLPIRRQVPLNVNRGLFMRFLAEVDPELAEKVHGSHGIPPYTTQLWISGPNAYLTVNLFSKALNDAFRSFVLHQDKMVFFLGRVESILVKVEITTVCIGEIVDDANPVTRFKLVFKRPTYFKTKNGTIVLYPEPPVLFQNLARIWNDITGDLEPVDTEAFCNWIASNVQITSYKLQTAWARLGKNNSRSVTGFKGWAKFKVNDLETHKEQEIIDFLLKFAHYCNLGGNRTTGLGVIKYLPIPAERGG